jgi:hypothetical protein
MRATPFKYLLIALMVVSCVGRPWAQALTVSPAHGCGGASAAAMEPGTAMAAQAAGRIAAGETAMASHPADSSMSAACVKSCAVTPMLGQMDQMWSAEVWPQAHPLAVDVALRGYPPKPELSPPIARV